MNESTTIPCDSDPSALTIDQARSRIIAKLVSLNNSEKVESHEALGRIVHADILSPINVPSFRASAMDGYALRSHESRETLAISGESLAGHPGNNILAPKTCQRITTGARIPDDADAVVQQENVTVAGRLLTVNKHPEVGTHVRNPGSDSLQNSILIKRGAKIGAAEIALLASHGITDLLVAERLRIAIFSTGDELVEPGNKRKSGQIFDANRALLTSLLASPNNQVTDLGICPDTRADLAGFMSQANCHDIVISSGGVSVGDADHVKQVLGETGSVELWKIAMKPGRPLTFGLSNNKTPFFGLPGNPVSAALTCLLFVIPAIAYLLGTHHSIPPPLKLPLDGQLKKIPGRVEYQRAVIAKNEAGNWVARTTGIQDSHVLTSLHKANCLIELPINSSGANHGDAVTVYPFSSLSGNLTCAIG